MSCLSQIGDCMCVPCRKSGASTEVVSHSGHPQTIARYSFAIRCACMSKPNRLAAAAFLATRTRPLVSRSSRLTIDTWPPFAISKARSCFNSPQSVRALLGLVGCTRRNGGLSTTMKSSLSATTVKFWWFARGGSVADKAGLIILKNLSREYTSGQRTVHALDGVSLEIAGNEFVAISGPSGCGKSTLIHLLAGLDRPTAGEIVVDGLALQTANDAALTDFRRHKVGLVFQFFNLLPTMNVRENVCLPLLLQGVSPKESDERAGKLIELVGLRERSDHFVHPLSRGD